MPLWLRVHRKVTKEMPKDNRWMALAWMADNKDVVTRVDMDLIEKLFSDVVPNHVEWTSMLAHSGRSYLGTDIVAAMDTAIDFIRDRLGGEEPQLEWLIDDVRMSNKFAHLVAFYVLEVMALTGRRMLSIAASDRIIQKLQTHKLRMAQIKQVGQAYALPSVPTQSRGDTRRLVASMIY